LDQESLIQVKNKNFRPFNKQLRHN